jgi:hypothetical protein
LRAEAEAEIRQYLESIATAFREEGLKVRAMVTGSGPARTIVAVSESEAVDLIMLATHGRGGLDRLFMGSVADRVVQQTRRPVFLVPVQERRASSRRSAAYSTLIGARVNVPSSDVPISSSKPRLTR